MRIDRRALTARARLHPIALLSVVALLAACTSPAGSASPGLTPSAPTATTDPTPRVTAPPIAANPDGCPAPTEPISPFVFIRYGDECFPSGATVEGWWQKSADGAVTLGQRAGSVDARSRNLTPVSVALAGGQSLPSDAGYGRFVAQLATPEQPSIGDATYTPLASPAVACPTTGPIPVGLFLQTRADCYPPGVDVTIAGWRDTLDGLCGCEGMTWIEKPGWLVGQNGIGWLFAEPENINLDDYLTVYAPDEGALGADSGVRPTYMEVTGHFDDPAAATCRAIADPSRPPGETLDKEGEARLTKALKVACANRFVLTSVREVAPPRTALAFCPVENPVPVAAILASQLWLPLVERLCFGGGDLAISGWFDPRPSAGMAPTIDPAWLDPFGRPGLWSSAADVYVSGSWLFLFTDPARPAALPATAGWYTMTGHFDDPAAAACVRTDGANAGRDGDCRSSFVVTGVVPGRT